VAPIEKGDHDMLDEAADTAGDLMTRDVAVAQAPDTSLLEAVRLTAQRRISGMPVVDDYGTIVGMMSEGDLIRWHEGYAERQARWLDMLADGTEIAPALLKEIQEHHRETKSVTSAGATTVTEDTLAREIAQLMCVKNIKRASRATRRQTNRYCGAFRSYASTRPKIGREASP
jgi:CBS-domain-containing membrane protein